MKRINLSTAFSGIKFNSKKLLFFIIALFSMFSCLVEEEIPETNFEVTIETVDASSITDSSAIVGVIISSNDKSQVSLTIGVCLNTTGNPTTSDLAYEGSGELGQFTVKITELNAATKYYARAYVTNAAGTTLYGNEVYFTTMPKNAGTVTDADGNVYQTVKIGSQIWMVENLKTTKYNDGTSIPYVTVDATWVSQTTPAYCWLSNSAVNYKESYGALYNWYAVNTGKLAPAGWHVPTDADWTELTTYLGGEIDCAGQLKDKGTALWLTPNTGANNISGFTGRPGGSRSNDGLFYGVGGYGYWWTSTEGNAAGGWGRSLTYNTTTVGRLNYYKGCGFSVRCIKGDPLGFPVLTTTDISSISTTSASSGGNITSDGGSTITARGVCWSTKTNPIITDTTKTTNGAGIGNFISTISGLKASTTYYVRAYATNTMGTAYGNEVSFTTSTPVGLPTLSTTTPTSITSTSAAGGGNITSDGGLIVTARGICWSTAVNPTVLLTTKTSNGTGIGTFTSSMTGLTANTTYYVRAYATNSAGTAYGTQLSFTTTNVAAALPTVSTTAISSILTTSATSGGNITADGGATVTVKGVCWSTTATPTIANSKTSDGIGTGTFTSSITGLTANTTYYVRAYATNSVGTSYGNEVSFKTASVTNNLLTNYDFETWSAGVPTGWTLTTTTGGTVTQSTTTPTGSGSSFQIAGPTATYSISQVIPPPAGASTFDTNKTYKISVKYLAKAGDGTDARVWSSFVTSAVGVTPLVYYITPTSHLDSVLSYYSLHGPGGYRTLSAGVFGDDYNTYLLDNRISGLWHTYSCLFKFPAGITQFGFMVRTYSASTVIWDDMYFGEYDGVSPTSGFMGTSSISGVTATSATSGGYFVNDGGSSIITRGVCWSTAPNPTISNSKTVDGNGTNTYTSSITGLTLNTTYYVRAYATNSVGTCYGDEQIFKTSIVSTVPVISTTAVSAITATTAT
ncbi:MAG: FISUMP domain-containing protein, partial [Paludibacter sp.]